MRGNPVETEKGINMSSNIRNISRLYRVCEKSITMTTGTLNYDRVVDGIIKLADSVRLYDGESDELWYLEGIWGSLDDFIIGAYWHFTEWHSGQASKGYQALSVLGQIYTPNMEMPDEDNIYYSTLDDMAGES